MRRAGALSAALVLLVLTAACGARESEPSASALCEPPDGASPTLGDARSLAGDFRLTLVATRGSKAGSAVTGELHLQPFDDASPYPAPAPGVPGSEASYPLRGVASVALDSVGAEAPGSIGEADPTRPGVLVIETAAAPPASGSDVVVRMGSEGNRSDVTAFDGAHMALFVRALSADGFGGDWGSGIVGQEAGGHFCAERTRPNG